MDVDFEKGKDISGLAYGEASRFVPVLAGTQQIQVTASGTDFVAIDVAPTLEKMTAYTVLAINELANIEPLLLVDDLSSPAKGFLKLRVVHAAPAAPAVDVYVSAPGTDLPSEPTIDGLDFKQATGYLEVPAANYQVRVTLDESSDVIFDSGSLDLTSATNLTIAAIETDMGLSPIKLLALTPDPKTPSLELVDQRSRVKVVHASPDAPAVDVLLNDTLVLSDVPFSVASNYLTVPSGEQNFKVNVAGTNTTVIDVTPQLIPGTDYTVLATNFVADIAPLLLEDANPVLASGQSGLRVIHASPDAPAVDVLVNGAVTIPALDYQVATDFLSVAADTYEVKVNVAGTATSVIEAELNLEAGTNYTVVAVGSVAAGTLKPIVLTD